MDDKPGQMDNCMDNCYSGEMELQRILEEKTCVSHYESNSCKNSELSFYRIAKDTIYNLLNNTIYILFNPLSAVALPLTRKIVWW